MNVAKLIKLAKTLDNKQEYRLADKIENITRLAFLGENTILDIAKKELPDLIDNFIETPAKKITNNIGKFNIRSRSYGEPLSRVRGLAPAYAEAMQLNNLRKLYPQMTEQQLLAQLGHTQAINQQAINEAVQMMPMNQRMYDNPLAWQNFNQGAWQNVPPSVKAALGLGTAALLWPTGSGPKAGQPMQARAANDTGYRFIGKDTKTGGDWYTDGTRNWYQDPTNGQWYPYALNAFQQQSPQTNYQFLGNDVNTGGKWYSDGYNNWYQDPSTGQWQNFSQPQSENTPQQLHDPNSPAYQSNYGAFAGIAGGSIALPTGIAIAMHRQEKQASAAYEKWIALHQQAQRAVNSGDYATAQKLAAESEPFYKQWYRVFKNSQPFEQAAYKNVVDSHDALFAALKNTKGAGAEIAETAGKTIGKEVLDIGKQVIRHVR